MEIKTQILLIAALLGLLSAVVTVSLSGALFSTRAIRALQRAEAAGVQDAALNRSPETALERKLREADLSLTPAQYVLLSAGLGLAGLLAAWQFFIPGLPAILLGGLLACVPFAWLKERASTRGLRIDEQLPLALSRIAAGLQANHGLDSILDATARSLPPGNPLSPELERTAQMIRTTSPEAGVRALAERSPSLSLSTTAMLLESYLRAGGAQYAGVVSEGALQIQRVIATRNHARAKAVQALQSARFLPVLLGAVLIMLRTDAVTREAFSAPLVQIAVSVVMLIMLGGYQLMRSEIRKVV